MEPTPDPESAHAHDWAVEACESHPDRPPSWEIVGWYATYEEAHRAFTTCVLEQRAIRQLKLLGPAEPHGTRRLYAYWED